MGQLGSTGLNWAQSSETEQLKSVDFPVLSRKPLERSWRTLALQGIAVLAVLAVLRALHRNGIGGNPAQS